MRQWGASSRPTTSDSRRWLNSFAPPRLSVLLRDWIRETRPQRRRGNHRYSNTTQRRRIVCTSYWSPAFLENPLATRRSDRERLGNGIEDARQLVRRLGTTADVPQLRRVFRVEPRLHVRELAAVDLQARAKRGHEFQRGLEMIHVGMYVGEEAEFHGVMIGTIV